jgi:hypothetical protein
LYALGFRTFERNNFKDCCFNWRQEKAFSFGKQGKVKKNVLTAKNPPVFYLNFLKGVEHASDHVTTPFLSANKKLRGFEHAHLKNRIEKANLSTFWARPTWDMVRRGLEKKETKEFFAARVHADQVTILKNLNGTVHNCVCD